MPSDAEFCRRFRDERFASVVEQLPNATPTDNPHIVEFDCVVSHRNNGRRAYVRRLDAESAENDRLEFGCPEGHRDDIHAFLHERGILENPPARPRPLPQSANGAGRDTPGIICLRDALNNPDMLRPPVARIPYLAYEGRTTLFAAAEKSGKTTFASMGVSAATAERPFLDVPTMRCTAVWCSLEEYLPDPVQRFLRQNAVPERVHIVHGLPPTLGARVAQLREYVDMLNADVLVIDTLTAFAEGSVQDANSAAQMQPVVGGLTRLAHETGVSVLILHHMTKSGGGYRDSSAIGAAVDIIVEMSAPDDGDAMMRQFTVRGRIPTSNFAARYVNGAYELAAARASIDLLVLDYVGAHPACTQKAIRAGVRARNDAIDAALQQLIQRGLVVDDGLGSRHAYRVPGANVPAVPTELRIL